MKRLLLILPLFFILLIFSCNKENKYDTEVPNTISETGTNYDEVERNTEQELTPKDVLEQPQEDITVSTGGVVTDKELKQIGKKLIKTANISFETKKYDDFVKNVKESIKKFDSYIDSESETNYSGIRQNTIIIRVKAPQFDSLLNLIFKGEGKVTSKTINVQDITAEYVDVYQHLKSEMLIKKRYEDILQKAYTVNDILNVTKYLNQSDIAIDNLKGRLKYINSQSQYSTITLTISEKDTSIQKNQFWKKVGEALMNGWTGLQYFIIVVIISLWPVWIVVIIIIFVVIKIRKKKHNTNK